MLLRLCILALLATAACSDEIVRDVVPPGLVGVWTEVELDFGGFTDDGIQVTVSQTRLDFYYDPVVWGDDASPPPCIVESTKEYDAGRKLAVICNTASYDPEDPLGPPDDDYRDTYYFTLPDWRGRTEIERSSWYPGGVDVDPVGTVFERAPS